MTSVSRLLWSLGIVVLMALLLVRQRILITRIGYQISELERRRDTLQESNRKLAFEVSRASTPESIIAKVGELDLHLVDPYAWQHERRANRPSHTRPARFRGGRRHIRRTGGR